MSDANFPIDRKRMADGNVKPASAIHVATNGATDPPLPPSSASASVAEPKLKPAFRPAKDDTKPTLRDPVRRFIKSISRSDPIVTEQAMLRLPPFPRSFTQF